MGDETKRVLEDAKTIAVVGLSDNPGRTSYHVAKYMQEQGYKIIPVNPTIKEALGEKAYSCLQDVEEKVDIVDVFRRSEDVPPVAEGAIAIGAKCLWLQLGIVNEEAASRAKSAGLDVVMDHCIMIEHRRVSEEE